MAEFGVETSPILLLTDSYIPLYYMYHLKLRQEGGALNLYKKKREGDVVL